MVSNELALDHLIKKNSLNVDMNVTMNNLIPIERDIHVRILYLIKGPFLIVFANIDYFLLI